MKHPLPIHRAAIKSVAVLSVSPIEDDHLLLGGIFTGSRGTLHPDFEFVMTARLTLSSALTALRQDPIPIVFCERDLSPDTWKELLDQAGRLPSPPHLIVTSRHADDRLWTEALNLGAYDVLAKPLDSGEVMRIAISAWRRWQTGSGAC